MSTYQVHSSATPCATCCLLMVRRGGCCLTDSCAVQRGRGKYRLLWLHRRCCKEVEMCESLSLCLLTTVSTLPFHCCERNIMDAHLQRALRCAGALCKHSCTLLVFLIYICIKNQSDHSHPLHSCTKSNLLKKKKNQIKYVHFKTTIPKNTNSPHYKTIFVSWLLQLKKIK